MCEWLSMYAWSGCSVLAPACKPGLGGKSHFPSTKWIAGGKMWLLKLWNFVLFLCVCHGHMLDGDTTQSSGEHRSPPSPSLGHFESWDILLFCVWLLPVPYGFPVPVSAETNNLACTRTRLFLTTARQGEMWGYKKCGSGPIVLLCCNKKRLNI